MSYIRHEVMEPEIEECIEKFRRLRLYAPRRGTESLDTYVIEWAAYKRRIAQVAAECIIRLMPSVKEVYYTDLSEDYAGRDIDLVIKVEADNALLDREVEDTIEAILAKLTQAAGIRLHGHITPSSLFEVHRKSSLIGSRSQTILLARQS